jgi:hypothetical protein
MPIGVRSLLAGDQLSLQAILFGEDGEAPAHGGSTWRRNCPRGDRRGDLRSLQAPVR